MISLHNPTTKCRFCGMRLYRRLLPDRGYVYVHAKGWGARCADNRARGRDAISLAKKQEGRK